MERPICTLYILVELEMTAQGGSAYLRCGVLAHNAAFVCLQSIAMQCVRYISKQFIDILITEQAKQYIFKQLKHKDEGFCLKNVNVYKNFFEKIFLLLL